MIRNKKISAETMQIINTPISDVKTMAALGNAFWQTCIDEGLTPKEFHMRGIMPRPNSLESFLTLMKEGFNPEKAGGAEMFMAQKYTVEGDINLLMKSGELFGK